MYSEKEMKRQLWIGFWIGVGTLMAIEAVLIAIGLATGT